MQCQQQPNTITTTATATATSNRVRLPTPQNIQNARIHTCTLQHSQRPLSTHTCMTRTRNSFVSNSSWLKHLNVLSTHSFLSFWYKLIAIRYISCFTKMNRRSIDLDVVRKVRLYFGYFGRNVFRTFMPCHIILFSSFLSFPFLLWVY